MLATLAAGLVVLHAAEAQYSMPVVTSATGGGSRGGGAGSFVGGFTPTNIVNQPVNVGQATKPINIQQAAMPGQMSTKVFNVNSAFSKVSMPLFQSGAPSTPVVKPGVNNPIQPVPTPKTKVAQPVPRSKILGFIPWNY